MSDSEDHIDSPDDGGDDLFGDGDNDQLSDQEQPLSDHGLESDREEEQRYGDEEDDEAENRLMKTKLVMGVQLYRHKTPKPKNGTLQSLRVPPFLKWSPEEYKSATFEPSKWDLENSRDPKSKPVARFRKDPKKGQLQSNTMIYKWSDGSVTMAVGDEHYEVQTKALAPPSNKPYQELQDAHYYAAAAHLSSNALLVVGHVTEQYTVRPNKAVEDDALKRLQDRLAAAKKSSHAAEGDMIIRTTQDPELQKKQAELAEKERERARRRRENVAARMDGMSGRYGRGALSIDGLEGGRRVPGSGRKRGMPGTPRQKRRRPEYDSDDDLPQGARRQEDYDLADDFIAPSDEDISVEEEEEEEEILDDDDEDEAPRSKRQKAAEADDEDADADGDLDDDVAPSSVPAESSRRGRRHIIDEDDEE